MIANILNEICAERIDPQYDNQNAFYWNSGVYLYLFYLRTVKSINGVLV